MAKKKIYKRWWFWLIIIVLVVGIGNLGNSKDKDVATKNEAQETNAKVSSQKNEEKTPEKDKKEDSKITYENFLKVAMGQSYEDVCALLGEGVESSSADIGGVSSKNYSWKAKGIANMNVTVQDGVIVGKAQAGLKAGNVNVTLDKYNSVKEGMSLEEVNKILGEGELITENKIMDMGSSMYAWINKDASNCNITFQDGVVTMKAQLNLK